MQKESNSSLQQQSHFSLSFCKTYSWSVWKLNNCLHSWQKILLWTTGLVADKNYIPTEKVGIKKSKQRAAASRSLLAWKNSAAAFRLIITSEPTPNFSSTWSDTRAHSKFCHSTTHLHARIVFLSSIHPLQHYSSSSINQEHLPFLFWSACLLSSSSTGSHLDYSQVFSNPPNCLKRHIKQC